MSLEEKQSRILTRRRFLSGTAATFAGVVGAPYILRAAPAPQKLNVAFVGTGGRAGNHVGDLLDPQKKFRDSVNCVAYSDVDTNAHGHIKELAPNAKAFTDWRKMFDEHLKNIDAVIVTTPDHSHAGPSMRAILEGKAVYCEKPLTWSVQEARALAEASARKKVATQMGNQGHSNEGNRLVVEWIRGGAIGDVQEVHTWTNRPVWPQGNIERPAPKPVPSNLNWDAWLGPAEWREYHEGLHGFKWRGWFDFGCGAVGDMGCHTWDCVFWALDPDYPSTIELLEIENKGKETFASRTHFKWEFPAKGNRPAFVAHWYSGGFKPETPEEYANDPALQEKDDKGNAKKRKLPDSATMFIGTKGKMLVTGDYGDSPRLFPESAMKEFSPNRPPKSIPRSPGHMAEFIMAARGEKPWDFPGSNFSGYAAPLTEVMLLGSIAEKIGEVGLKIECNPTARTVISKEAIPHLGREYRKGWEVPGLGGTKVGSDDAKSDDAKSDDAKTASQTTA